jgi:hypothetical protein
MSIIIIANRATEKQPMSIIVIDNLATNNRSSAQA